MCELLDGYAQKKIISFLDIYQNVRYNMPYLRPKELTEEDYKKIGLSFSNIAKEHNMTVQTMMKKESKKILKCMMIKVAC